MVKRSLFVVAALAALAAAQPASAATTAWFQFESLQLNAVSQAPTSITGGVTGTKLTINTPNTAGTWRVGVNLMLTTTDNMYAWNYDLQSPSGIGATPVIRGIAGATGFTRFNCLTTNSQNGGSQDTFDSPAPPATSAAGTIAAPGIMYNDGGASNGLDVPDQERLVTASCKIAQYRFTVTNTGGVTQLIDISAATGGQGTFGGDATTPQQEVAVNTLFGGNVATIGGAPNPRQVTAFPVITINQTPEPATLTLLALGAVMVLRRKR